MKKIAVLGASGGMGYSLVNELVRQGFEVTAFARNKKKLERLFGGVREIDIKTGDAFKEEDILQACKGAEVIFHTVSVPYSDWTDGHPAIMRHAVQAAKIEQAKLIIIDNIYAYGRQYSKKVTENAQKNPHTKKGKIRLSLENMVREAGIPYMILHFPDYYGPNAENSLLHQTLKNVMANKRAIFIGDMEIKREFIYTPDGAKAAVTLILNEEAYGQNWNIPGAGTISGNEIISLLKTEAGYSRPVMKIGKRAIWFMGLFNRNMKEVREMMYLNEQPVILSGEKYEQKAGPLPSTSYKRGISETLAFMARSEHS
ncbi:SDR family NAD(P)-dependent oxidoreductase [Bacillus sp. FJAT-42376]|uniref:SDR family NAD(P)-dependent oxidoreductase n=1 Tax=Bacillus sp. FJAT-42376 TaxID=2014076 RepID=UPI000F506BC9|nr:SDR family NAD(P)-dependent oxidoreductase [Bacillus sp. FJAT-42376]AZB40973.1 SDR family NAD(P)-dependent oxidoreductase [Bacillus sp. FJAT-42376]